MVADVFVLGCDIRLGWVFLFWQRITGCYPITETETQKEVEDAFCNYHDGLLTFLKGRIIL